MIRSVVSVVSALSGGVANNHQTFLPVSSAPSTHSVRWVFPSTAGSQSFAQSAPSVSPPLPGPTCSPRSPTLSRGLLALSGNPLTVSSARFHGLDPQVLRSGLRFYCPLPFWCYYDLIRQSLGFRGAWPDLRLLSTLFASFRMTQVTFSSLL